MRARTLLLQTLMLIALVLCFPAPPLPAQGLELSRDTPFFLPQTIYVGDQGRLIVPLGLEYNTAEPFVWDSADLLPQLPNLVFRRIEFERRGGVNRLLIDFISYEPGILLVPDLELPLMPGLPPDTEPLVVQGLELQIASILSPGQMTLSEPAPPLAAPGTSLLVYGTLALLIFLLSLGIGGSIWGRRHFAELWERFRRRHLLRMMIRFLFRLRRESSLEKDGNPGFYLTILSTEFREFLSQFTGINCRPLSAGEFKDLPLGYEEGDEDLPEKDFLCGLFRTWDTFRFSGGGIKMMDLFQALRDTEGFILALDRAEKALPLPSSTKKTTELVLDPGVPT
ncbi:MAG: hypothetical protein FWH12_07045 [Treponema sp.]|nr:hypothetical protein [Treponema sp.]